MSAHFTAENRVGRVIEVRVFNLPGREDIDDYSRVLGLLVAKMPIGSVPILCADHRPVKVYSPPVSDRLVELFTSMNTRLSRVAIIVSHTNATLALQLERIVRTAAFPGRRVFYGSEEAVSHLDSTLNLAELDRVRAFLSEFQGEPDSQRPSSKRSLQS